MPRETFLDTFDQQLLLDEVSNWITWAEKKRSQLDCPFVVVVFDKRQMGDNKYLSRQPGHRQM